MNKSIWKKTIREDADEEGVGLCDRNEGRICAKKREGVPIVKRKREEMREFIRKQLRKGYIQLLKSSQIAPVFFVGKKDGKVDGTRLLISE